MPPELKERLLQQLREQGKVPPDLDDEQLDRLMETCWGAAQVLAMAVQELIEQVLPVLRSAWDVLTANLQHLIHVVNESLPTLLDSIHEILKPRQKLPHPPKRIGAPRARKIFDHRPLTRHARTTI